MSLSEKCCDLPILNRQYEQPKEMIYVVPVTLQHDIIDFSDRIFNIFTSFNIIFYTINVPVFMNFVNSGRNLLLPVTATFLKQKYNLKIITYLFQVEKYNF